MPKPKLGTATINPALLLPLQADEVLAVIGGSQPQSRTEITRKLWDYIKKHGLQDKKNKTSINADAALREVFDGEKQVTMFAMTKLVSGHLTDVDDKTFLPVEEGHLPNATASVDKTISRKLLDALTEAVDDDPAVAQLVLRKLRAGQVQFRSNLLDLYDSKCAVSNTGPENVLEACHILTHSETGINRSDNGLLLRSDIHSLFDDALLLIDPETLLVKIDPTLKETHYWQFNGQKIRPTTKGKYPNKKHLAQRFHSSTE